MLYDQAPLEVERSQSRRVVQGEGAAPCRQAKTEGTTDGSDTRGPLQILQRCKLVHVFTYARFKAWASRM